MEYYGIIEVFLTFGLVVAFALWQFADLRKARRAREAEAARSAVEQNQQG